MNQADKQYLMGIQDLIHKGDKRSGRNGEIYSLFGRQMRFDLAEGFPLLTTKKVHTKSIIVELLWFLRGDTNIKYLHDHGVTIWDEWADENGNLGPVYGAQWRSWNTGKFSCELSTKLYNPITYETIDQIMGVITSIKNDPFGRRHIVTAWNPAEIENMALPPCHCLFQFHVTTDGKLNLQLYQRSADWFLGVPFNIASYALLLILIARETNLEPGEFIHSFGDYHLYGNHIEQALEQFNRPILSKLPQIKINSNAGIFDLNYSDFELIGYEPQGAIKAPVSK